VLLIPGSVRVFVARESVDMRKSFESLGAETPSYERCVAMGGSILKKGGPAHHVELACDLQAA